jgi:hypothetical protein
MDPNLNSQLANSIDRVRKLAAKRLTQLARNVDKPQEIFQFKKGLLCGVKFELNEFQMQWRFDTAFVDVFRVADLVDQIQLDSVPVRKAG